jgi:hypothetical protein
VHYFRHHCTWILFEPLLPKQCYWKKKYPCPYFIHNLQWKMIHSQTRDVCFNWYTCIRPCSDSCVDWKRSLRSEAEKLVCNLQPSSSFALSPDIWYRSINSKKWQILFSDYGDSDQNQLEKSKKSVTLFSMCYTGIWWRGCYTAHVN